MIAIPNTTLVIVDCVEAARAEKVIEETLKLCSFDDVKFLTSLDTNSPYRVKIAPIKTQNEYSEFILRHSYKYCDTLHMQIIQFDGWVVNPETWDDNWCQYDYIGALFDGDPNNDFMVGNGGFSFRSRRLMSFVSENMKGELGSGYNGYYNCDGVISLGMRTVLTEAGFKFAPSSVARKYSLERCVKNMYNKPYGFHSFYALGLLRNQ
jgi:hypothetical protein